MIKVSWEICTAMFWCSRGEISGERNILLCLCECKLTQCLLFLCLLCILIGSIYTRHIIAFCGLATCLSFCWVNVQSVCISGIRYPPRRKMRTSKPFQPSNRFLLLMLVQRPLRKKWGWDHLSLTRKKG